MRTRLSYKRLVRQCRNKSTSDPGEALRCNDKFPYLARDITNPHYVKLGCSNHPMRRVKDRNFGKAPVAIRKTIKQLENRVIDTVFLPTRNAKLSGAFLERSFHRQFEECHTAGEWLSSSLRPKIVSWFVKRGWRPVRKNIRGL